MICIARKLANKLNNIEILELNKIATIIQNDNWKQFCIMEWNSKWSLFGGIEESDFKYSEDDAIKALAKSIKSHSKSVRFNVLNIPYKAVEEIGTNCYGNVWVRMVCDYIPMSDMLINRYDVLIEKVNSNV